MAQINQVTIVGKNLRRREVLLFTGDFKVINDTAGSKAARAAALVFVKSAKAVAPISAPRRGAGR